MSKATSIRLPSKDDLAQLEHYSNLLHLLHHRNQNQHRRSIWYRHFSLFRRQFTALLADYTTLSATPATNVERTRLKALAPGLHTRISQRLTFWQDVLVAGWMRAFSQVVADGRFSVLGLVMLGVLGGVCKIVGVVDGLEAEGQAEIEKVLEDFGKEAWGGDGGFGEAVARGDDGKGEAVLRIDEGEPMAREDVGEIVARRDDDDDEMLEGGDKAPNDTCQTSAKAKEAALDQSEEDEPKQATVAQKRPSSPSKKVKAKTSSTKKRPTEEKTKSTKKKRKKGGDAIDDLFSGW